MREILFRGKSVDGGEWLYGHYVHQYGADMIYLPDGVDREYGFDYYHIDKETVGQYTGLTDKNGKKRFEGDIIKYLYHKSYNVIAFENGAFGYTTKRFECFRSFDDGEDGIAADLAEVIGNIHDNPELLKESEDTE